MRRALLIIAFVTLGVLAGGWSAMLASPRVPAVSTPTSTSTTLPTSTAITLAETGHSLYLVWTSGGLPAGFTEEVLQLSGVEAVTEIWSDVIYITEATTPDGFVIPIEAFAVDPTTFAKFLPLSAQPSLSALADGTGLFGSTAADRRAGVGQLHLADGTTLPVVGVIDDSLIGAAELVVTQKTGAQVGVTTPRFLLLTYRGDRALLEGEVRAAAGIPVRIRAPGETPYLRHGDAVLPQSLIKEQFGEFALKPSTGRQFTVDPEWLSRSIVSEEIPLLGRVNCHRSLVPLLSGAMEDLQTTGLANLISDNGFQGCWNPRFIAVGAGLSRHAWGAAVDINYQDNPTGLNAYQDPRLVEVMLRWGFTWGGNWLVPDPAHFEFAADPLTGMP